MNGYREDLAWIHDTGFSSFARHAAPGLLALLRRPLGRSARQGRVRGAGDRFVARDDRAGRQPGSNRFAQDDDWAVLVRATEDPRARILTRRITTFRKAGRSYRRAEETHRLKLYRPAGVAALLIRTGFTVRYLPGYGSLRLPAGHAALMARRNS